MALKDYNNLLCVVTKHKDMELYVLYNKEFKIAVLRKLSYKNLQTIQWNQENNT